MADILTYDDEELVAVSVDVIVVILSLIGLAIFLLTPPNEFDHFGAYRLDLKEVIQDVFQNKQFKVQWISKNELLCHDSNGSLSILKIQSNSNFTSKSLIHHSIINRFNIQKTKLSPDKQLILLESSKQLNFPYTQLCDYYIYNVSSEIVIGLREDLLKKYFESRTKFNTSNPLEESRQILNSINLQYAEWQNSKKTNLLLIINNDLYFIDQLNTARIDNLERLTFDGLSFTIYNGIMDSIYSKFLMNVNYLNNELNYELSLSTVFWSLNGQFLLYVSFNNSLINQNTINLYTDLNDLTNNIPNTQQIPYPLPGKPHPIVNLYIQEFDSNSKPFKQRIKIKLPIELINIDFYLINVQWTTQSDLILFFVLRTLNNSLIIHCTKSSDFICKTLIQLPLERGSFTMSDFSSSLMRNNQNDIYYFLRFPQRNNLFNQIIGFNLKNTQLNHLTYGSFDVTKLLAFDYQLNKLYFQATKNNQLESRHIYELKLSSNRRSTDFIKCLTCDLYKNSITDKNLEYNQNSDNNIDYNNFFQPINLTLQNAEINDKIKNAGKWMLHCNNYDASFSSDFKYFVLSCNGPNVPSIELWQNEPRRKISTIYRNFELEKALGDKRLPKEMFLAVPLTDDYKAYAKLIFPPPKTLQDELETEDDELELLYPMIIECVSLNAYNTTTINNKYQISWPQYLASKKQIIYAQIFKNKRTNLFKQKTSIDKLDNNRKQQYLKENLVDTRSLNQIFKDQLSIVKYLVDNFSNIDRKRIILIGTDTSAYTALGTLAEDEHNLVRAAIAIAPVVNWINIDSITAEYNLGFPSRPEDFAQYDKENLIYKRNSLIKGKKFLLISGTADETVGIQHTMQLIRSLITDFEHNKENSINYQIQLYPDENHQLTNCKYHMYTLIENYINHIFT